MTVDMIHMMMMIEALLSAIGSVNMIRNGDDDDYHDDHSESDRK